MMINYSLMSSAGASLYMYKISEVRYYSAIARYSFQQCLIPCTLPTLFSFIQTTSWMTMTSMPERTGNRGDEFVQLEVSDTVNLDMQDAEDIPKSECLDNRAEVSS